MKRIALLAALLATLPLSGTVVAAPAADAQSAQSRERQVDALFAKWRRPDSPGAVVEVIRDGKVVLTKSYGMADIERGVPMSPATAFFIGSMSKQFTAFAIHLLAQDGKLSLDDDIRTYLPDVPDFGKTITIRHLLHHTSGLRDYFDMLFMAGLRQDDVVTEDMSMGLIGRQRALNFDPGQEYEYSNTGYLLLARIVQRVSGKPLPEFARERIFAPLGMKHTLYQRGYGNLVPGRALSYLPAGGGYRYVAVAESTTGAGGVLSTAGDMALWDRNFYDGRVGGAEVIKQMQATGVLNDGKPIEYASGLLVHSYRGLPMVEHGGAIGGYRTQLWRFPVQRLSVLVFANTSDIDLYQSTRRIADLYLGQVPGIENAAPAPAPAKAFREIAVDPARLDALVGYYATSPQTGVAFTREDGRLMALGTGLPKIQVFAYGERDFFARDMDAQFSFDAPGQDGVVAGGMLHWGGQEVPARRTVLPVPSAAEARRLEGQFYSDELHALYSVAYKDGDLVLTYPRGAVTLGINAQGHYATGFGTIQYQCAGQVACAGFTLSTGRARNVQFTRVELPPPGK